MKLIIDCREKALYDICNSLNAENTITISFESMPIGDALIEHNGIPQVLIERKTLNDLASSIIDGRYSEQSCRLDNSEINNHNIIYVIEGDINKYSGKSRITKNTLLSSLVSLNYYKGFSVYKTINVNETANFLIALINKITKELNNRQPYYINQPAIIPKAEEPDLNAPADNVALNDVTNNASNDASDDVTNDLSYCFVHKNIKKNNITTSNILTIFLSQIPNVSTVSAIAITNKYKTLKDLLMDLEQNENCLDDVIYTTNNSQRHISKLCKQNVRKYILQL